MPKAGVAISAVRNAEGYRQNNGFPGSGHPAGPDMSDPVLLRGLLDHVPTPAAAVDPDRLICLFANAAYRELGVEAGASLPQQFPAASASLLTAAGRSGAPQRDLAAGTGSQRWDVQAIPVAGSEGKPRVLLVTAREVPPVMPEQEGQVREVSHRAKNTLQLVSSLLTLQALGTRDPEIRRAFQNAGSRIGMVTQAHQRIHSGLTAGAVDFAGHLRDLCAELEAGAAGGDGLRAIRADAEPALLPVDSVVPLTLIAGELIVNALKHAYSPEEPGNLTVSLHHGEDGRLYLTVADHGRGLPPDLDVSRASSLGFKIARAFATQLKGRLRAEPNHPGARLIVDLPGQPAAT